MQFTFMRAAHLDKLSVLTCSWDLETDTAHGKELDMTRVAIGPHDLRKRRTRCRQCAQKHLKCNGERPCSQCNARGSTCEWSSDDQRAQAVFVQVDQSTGSLGALSRGIRTGSDDLWTQYLIIHIGPLVTFSGASRPLHDIKPLLQLSPALRSASAAAGAMFCVRGRTLSDTGSKEIRTAFEKYAAAVTQVKLAVAQPEKFARAPTLWAVFLLSLFELMADATGQNWIKHTLFGISQLLEAIGPSKMLQSEYRTFFMEVCIFEVSRALITTTETILARPQWRSMRARISKECHPNQRLVNVMIDAADLGWRATKMIASLGTGDEPNAASMHRYVEEAEILQVALRDQESKGSLLLSEVERCFRKVHHAAISIYLSGIFDYHTMLWQRSNRSIPTLQSAEVQFYVDIILVYTERALKISELSGISYVFALRVAGARSPTTLQQEKVMALLRRIERCYFGVNALVVDLLQLWAARMSI